MNDDRSDKINETDLNTFEQNGNEINANDASENNGVNFTMIPNKAEDTENLNTAESVPANENNSVNGFEPSQDNNEVSHLEDIEPQDTVLQQTEADKENADRAPEALPGERTVETQRIWQMHNFQNAGGNFVPEGNNINNYYRESYKKPAKKSEAWKYILVSILSSIVGGAIITIALLLIAPMIQPQLRSIINEVFPNAAPNTTQIGTGELKRVEIVQNGESAVTSVAEKVGPSVVGIRTSYQNANSIFGVQAQDGEGSGIIISSDGYILTNFHVIENAVNDKTRAVQNGAKIQVFLPNKIEEPYTATVKGYDSKTDLAVLKINESNLPAIEFGDSDALKVGEAAVAIGNPGGLEYMGSVTTGVISGLNRTVQLDGGRKIKLIQTDAPINPGNSGGALVNIEGQLIGVNSVKLVATGFEGLGFAIPVNDAKKIADELIKNTYISKPYLGISVDQRYTEEVAKDNNMPMGVYVASVEILGAAEKAGIEAGDVIIKFNGKEVKSFADLEEEKNKFKAGDTVQIELFRDGQSKTVQVKLGETK